jgi:predicted transcriptional regulator
MEKEMFMKPLCENMIGELLPGFRALVAKKLMEDHGFSQTQVAAMLDTTQPAISQYKGELRGKKTKVFLEDPNLFKLLEKITKCIAKGEVKPEETGSEFCKVCKFLRENGLVSPASL